MGNSKTASREKGTEIEMVKCGEEMHVRLVVVADAHMQAIAKSSVQQDVGENTNDLFDTEHARRLLESAAFKTNAWRMVIDYKPGDNNDAINKLVYITAFLISSRTTLSARELRTVLNSVDHYANDEDSR